MLELTLEVIEPCLRYGDKYLTTTFATSFTPTESPGETLPWIPSGEPSLDPFWWTPSLEAVVFVFNEGRIFSGSLSLGEQLSSICHGTEFVSLSLNEALLLTRFKGFNSDALLKKTSLEVAAFSVLLRCSEWLSSNLVFLRRGESSNHQKPFSNVNGKQKNTNKISYLHD